MENLFDVLTALTKWCNAQPGALTWQLMQTSDEGRCGFQLFIVNHEAEADDFDVWHCNASELGRVATLAYDWLRARPPADQLAQVVRLMTRRPE
jgi:hypothetical protein